MGGYFENECGCGPQTRFFLFTVCVLVRITISFVIGFVAEHSHYSGGIAGIVYNGLVALAFAKSMFCGPGKQIWWFRSVHCAYAVIMVNISFAVYFDYVSGWLLGLFMSLDPLFGVVHAATIKPFSNFHVVATYQRMRPASNGEDQGAPPLMGHLDTLISQKQPNKFNVNDDENDDADF